MKEADTFRALALLTLIAAAVVGLVVWQAEVGGGTRTPGG